MLKNKAISVVLLIVVGIIWLNVIIKIVGNFSATEDNSVSDHIVDAPLLIPAPEDRDFELATNYRDPFLNQVKSTKKVSESPERSAFPIHARTQSTQAPKPWPKIHYYGIVKQTKGNGGLALIKVDNYSMNLKKGEGFYDDYEVYGVYRDSIVIRRGKKEYKSYYR